MDEEQGSAKRSRCDDANSSLGLSELLNQNLWDKATDYITHHPLEAKTLPDPSPLALACRFGAPYDCVRAILEAAPERLRRVLDSRGTPLHEAVVCETIGVDVIDLLLTVDESLGDGPQRATLLQDVDGFTPLHLLIRRRFQKHIMGLVEGAIDQNCFIEILELLVSSCPTAVVIPDRGEYEEPPIVYAIKAHLYAPVLGSEDATFTRVEGQIFEMVRTMLKHAPFAAAQVFSGFRGQYTALHSAVFHGRYINTVKLLLETGRDHPSATDKPAALLTNTQLEVPLHFCAMRGERPRTVAMLAKAAPDAVGKRDASGLTPFHWLWVRFASTLLSLDDDRRGVGEATISKTTHMPLPYKTNRYNNFTSIEQGDFDSDLQLFKRLDPPTDFLHMRNIPREVADSEIGLRCAKRAVSVLQRIRTRRFSRSTCEGEIWTRQEAVMGLFWTKCVSLLEASVTAGQEAAPLEDADSFRLVHSAFVSECCLPTVAYIAASLFPEELRIRDELGRLPIHCAASRSWHAREWPPIDSGPAARLLQGESLNSFRVAFDLTPNEAIRVVDKDNRLVLHLLIDNLVKACCQIAQANNVDLLEDTLQMLRDVVRSYPDSLQRRDGRSMLYPFMQVSAAANEFKQPSTACDELALTMTYELLRENPAVMLGS